MKSGQRSVRGASAAIFLAVVSTACATAGRAPEEPSGGAASQVITRDEIEETNARSAWDVLRSTVRYVHWGVGQAGAPQRGTRRGVSSGLGPEQVRVMLDGSVVQDLEDLRLLPARDLEEIRVLSGVDATTYFGTNSVAGAVLITTRR